MTLIEKFDKATDGWIVSHACEEIADDYAIEFGLWILKQCISPSLDDLYVDEKGDLISVKELLAIFKKEKGYESIV